MSTRYPERVPKVGLACTKECEELSVRASGEVICEECTLPNRKHPYCRGSVTCISGEPEFFIHVHCSGLHMKL